MTISATYMNYMTFRPELLPRTSQGKKAKKDDGADMADDVGDVKALDAALQDAKNNFFKRLKQSTATVARTLWWVQGMQFPAKPSKKKQLKRTALSKVVIDKEEEAANSSASENTRASCIDSETDDLSVDIPVLVGVLRVLIIVLRVLIVALIILLRARIIAEYSL